MGLFEQFPYTNFHELNLDWVLDNTQKAIDKVDQFNDDVLRFTTEIDEFDKKINGFEKQIDNMDDYIHETAADSATKTAKEVAPAAAVAEIKRMYAEGIIALPYDITQHGADKTGQTDCTAIINNVLNMYNVAFIPNGLYKIDSGITINTGQMLIGESSTSTILQCTENGVVSSKYFTNAGTGNTDGDYGFTIANLHLTGSNKGYGIIVYGYHFTIADCVIEKFKTGILSEYNKNTGFAPAGTTMEAIVERCLIQRNYQSAVDWYGPSDSRIVDCDISNGKTGLYIAENTNSTASGMTIQGCHLYTFKEGAAIEARIACQIYNTSIESSTYGINITNINVQVKGCFIYNITDYPIKTDIARAVIITDTTIIKGTNECFLYAAQQLSDSYISIYTFGAVTNTVNDPQMFDFESVVLNIFNPLNANTITRPKRPTFQYIQTVLADTYYTASRTNPIMVYLRTAGNVTVGNYLLGKQTSFLVGPGSTWKTDTATVAYYQTLY